MPERPSRGKPRSKSTLVFAPPAVLSTRCEESNEILGLQCSLATSGSPHRVWNSSVYCLLLFLETPDRVIGTDPITPPGWHHLQNTGQHLELGQNFSKLPRSSCLSIFVIPSGLCRSNHWRDKTCGLQDILSQHLPSPEMVVFPCVCLSCFAIIRRGYLLFVLPRRKIGLGL